MKTCPHCNQENPKNRILCVNCGHRLEEEKKAYKIINSIWGLIGGIVLILFDTDMVLSIGHVIPIPYGLSLIGIAIILFSLENIITNISPKFNSPEELPQTITEESSLSRAVVFGLIAGVVSASFWYGITITTQYHFGVFAIIVGWLIGTFAAFGFDWKKSLLLQSISVIICLSVLGLNEYFIMRHFFAQSVFQQGYTSLPLFLPSDISLSLVLEAWKSEPISIFFWIAALLSAFFTSGGLRINKPLSRNAPAKI